MIVFAVGASPVSKETEGFMKEALEKAGLKNVKGFYLRGAIDEEKMSFIHRTMMKAMRKSLSKKDVSELDYVSKAIIANGGKKEDWTDKSTIEQLVKYIEAR